MTTLVEEINAALSALAPAGGVWVMVNTAESGAFPYIVFQRIVSTTNASLGGPSNVQNTRVQVDVFDRQYRNAASLAAQVQASLLATFSSYPKSCVPISAFDGYEEAIKAYRVSADFSIWYDESSGLVIGGV